MKSRPYIAVAALWALALGGVTMTGAYATDDTPAQAETASALEQDGQVTQAPTQSTAEATVDDENADATAPAVDPAVNPAPTDLAADPATDLAPTNPAPDASITNETDEAPTSENAQTADDSYDASVIFDFVADSPSSQRADEIFKYTGTVTCNVDTGTIGCVSPVLTVPVPTEPLPEGATPFASWSTDLILPQSQGGTIHPTMNAEKTEWVYAFPNNIKDGESFSFTLRLQNKSGFQPQSYTFSVQPTLSSGVDGQNGNFAPVQAPAPIEYTGTFLEPDLQSFLSASYSTVYPGATVTFTSNLGGLYSYNRQTIFPGSGVYTVNVTAPFEFVSASSDDPDIINGVYDPTAGTVTYSNIGPTWEEWKAGERSVLAPLVLRIDPDYQVQNSTSGDNVSLAGTFTAETIALNPETISGTISSNALTIKGSLNTKDVIRANTTNAQFIGDTPVSEGNHGSGFSAPLPKFEGQTIQSLILQNSSANYDFEATWGVPCRSGSSPNVTVRSNPSCAADNVAFELQDLYVTPAEGSAEMSVPAVITRADGTTESVTISTDPVAVEAGSSPVVSVAMSGTVPATNSAYLVVAGVFPEGSLDGTAAQTNPGTSTTVINTWQAAAALTGNTLPTPEAFSANRTVNFATGASIIGMHNSSSSATSGTTTVNFALLSSSNAGPAIGSVLLPAQLNYQGIALPVGGVPPQVTRNWNGTGQTLIQVTIPEDQMSYEIQVRWQAREGGSYTITSAVNARGDVFTGDKCWMGGATAGPTDTSTTSHKYGGVFQASGTIAGMLNQGDTVGDPNGSCMRQEEVDITGLDTNKIGGFIKETNSSIWIPSPGLAWQTGSVINVKPGDTVDFRAQVQNYSLANMDAPVVYVGIPDVGATNPLQEGQSLGTQFNMTLASAVTVPAGWTVEYSTSTTPCQDELGVTSNCASDWTTTAPSDLSTVKFLRFEAASLATASVANFDYQLQLPDQAQLCQQLGEAADCTEYLDLVSWNLATMSYTTPGTTTSHNTYAALVGVGKFEAAAAYPNLSAEVLDGAGDPTGNAWAKAGDTIRFTQAISRDALDPRVAPYPIVKIDLSGIDDEATVNTKSFTVDGKPAVGVSYDADNHALIWDVGLLQSNTELSFDVTLGEAPAPLISAATTVIGTGNFEFTQCTEGVTPWPCNLTAAVPVPQVSAAITTAPASGSEVGLGDTIDYEATLTPAGIDASVGAVPAPVATWDVSGLKAYGTISGVTASSGTATYDADSGIISWEGADMVPGSATLKFQFEAADSLPADAGADVRAGADARADAGVDAVELSTRFDATVDSSFTPVHQGSEWTTTHTLKTTGDEGGEGGNGGGTPGTGGGSGTGTPGTGTPGTGGQSGTGALATTGAYLPFIGLVVLLPAGAALVMYRRRKARATRA